jgi:hypothetical protein
VTPAERNGITRDEWRAELRERQAQAARDRLANPRYHVYRCPTCGEQHLGPRAHRMACDDMCQGIGPDGEFHTSRLERIEVVPT